MQNLRAVLQQLEEERSSLQEQIGQINHAITALTGKGSRRKRVLSQAALAKIRAAQKARWAKWRKAKGRAR